VDEMVGFAEKHHALARDSDVKFIQFARVRVRVERLAQWD